MDDPVDLPLPKSFEIASFVGGVAGLAGRNDFPALSIDAFTKTLSQTDENLYTYLYSGQITWMVGGDNAKVIEQVAKGYGAALEMYIRDHTYHPYAAAFNAAALPFSFVDFTFLRAEFFGAANVELDQKGSRKLWVDGGRIDMAWNISENGPGQHG
jgi:hypothetical protein